MCALIRCMRCAFIYPGPGSDISDIGKIVWLKTRHHRDHCLSHTPIFRFAMGKHMTAHELDSMQAWKMQGASTKDIYRRPQRARSAGGGDGPNLATVRRALRGVTHRRGRAETRGRKRNLSPANVRALNTARKRLIEKADGQYEVHRDGVIRAARAPSVDRSIAAKGMKTAGYDIQWHTPSPNPRPRWHRRGREDEDMRQAAQEAGAILGNGDETRQCVALSAHRPRVATPVIVCSLSCSGH